MAPSKRHRVKFPETAKYLTSEALRKTVWDKIRDWGEGKTFALILNYTSKYCEILDAFNTERVLGILKENFTFGTYEKFPVHNFYKRADRTFSHIGLIMAREYPSLTNKIYHFPYPIMYKYLGRNYQVLVQRNTCLRKISGGYKGIYEYDVHVMIFRIIMPYNGDIIACLPEFQDNNNGYARMEKESKELVQKGAQELRRMLLTPQQVIILQHIVEGLQHRQIAEKMRVKTSTVRDHLGKLTQKLKDESLFTENVEIKRVALLFRKMQII